MKGKYHFRARSKKVLFDFTIRRNITVIKGESASGKTTLLHILYEYLRAGRESGYVVSADAPYFVYLRKEPGREWQDMLLSLSDTVIFIEENNEFVFGKEFAEFVKTSGNYFVIVNRAPLRMLPYSIHETYEIVTVGKRADVRESWHELRELYSNFPVRGNNRMRVIVTEDDKAGHQFFAGVYSDRKAVSAQGNGNISKVMQEMTEDALVIGDGAAFGAYIEDCIELLREKTDCRLSLWLPESFEYLILASGLIQGEEVRQAVVDPSMAVDCAEFESWEQFFTDLLIRATEDSQFHYQKKCLNEIYLSSRCVTVILRQFPKEILPQGAG